MEVLEKYNINITSLKNQEYAYTFEVKDDFFQNFAYGPVEKGSLKVDVSLTKSETMLHLKFKIKGKVQLICDRSLEEFEFPINLNETMILKFGDHYEVMSDELELIARNTVDINVAQYIYEYVGTAIPMKKLHPKFKAEEDDTEETVLVYSSENLAETPDTTEENSENIDPRWQILKNLKN